MARKEKGENKTNAMRILDRAGIAYEHFSYECDEFVDGAATADMLGLPHEQVFKTLITVAQDGQHYAFVIPIDLELDLKKCAKSVGAKSVAMIHQKDLFPLTGYVRGGCTAIGMKKNFITRLDQSAKAFERIYVSGGRVGCQIRLAPESYLRAAWKAEYADLTRKPSE
ncbi:MAG: Cys-tRNA(Pro) deacylase [Lachnospiraceae bacterium]|nr:Cys-tRNA(Pro) deacylase [Lachnospiraceae bacterium]MBR3188837.1 Cys-tRNA(Pro) deacylase [Lachnospiraceae bacterium]